MTRPHPRAALAALLFGGCADPALDPLGRSLVAWQAGVAALAEGDPARARAHFVAARRDDPQSPTLCVWESRALAAANDGGAALEVLEGCHDPAAPAVLRERASVYARRGAVREAAQALIPLVRRGLETPRSLGADPDLAVLLDHPDYPGLVVVAQPKLLPSLTPRHALVGDRWAVELILEDSPAPLSLHLGAGAGLRLEALIEDALGPAQAGGPRLVTLRGLATSPSADPVGPLTVRAPGASDAAAPLIQMDRVQLGAPSAPPPHPPPHPPLPGGWPESLPMPSAARALAPPGASARTGVWLILGGSPASPPVAQPEQGRPVRLELREDGQPTWVGLALHAGGGG